MLFDEQWWMIKENQLMMFVYGVVLLWILEVCNLWLILLKFWSCEGEIIDEQIFCCSFSDLVLSYVFDCWVFYEFFQQVVKVVVSKGISIFFFFFVVGLSSVMLVNDLFEQLENSFLLLWLLYLIILVEVILDYVESV